MRDSKWPTTRARVGSLLAGVCEEARERRILDDVGVVHRLQEPGLWEDAGEGLERIVDAVDRRGLVVVYGDA